jgi:hypothetical protein
MAESVFEDKAAMPDDEALAAVLGKTHPLWARIREPLAKEFDPIQPEWKFYGKKYGWTLKVQHKKRTILYLTPLTGGFRIAFVFGDKAVAAVEDSTVPEGIKEELRNARRYVEGRGLRIEVKSAKDVRTVKQLIHIKMTH